ncbi:hypothetical protein K3495_g6508 [Podosphaera aphanis]|nr:hypothetical protein K3495_g6508 [Podosphaera aphanis]
MASTKRIPPELEAYLTPGVPSPLTLLTSVLGATPNWLTLRLLSHALSGPSAVVLVSCLRDAAFWIEGAQRLGLDLARLSRARKFVCVDALDSLYLAGANGGPCPGVVTAGARLAQVVAAVRAAMLTLDAERVLLVVDGVDVLLAAEESLTAATLAGSLMELREDVYGTVLALAADAPLVTSLQTPLEREHAAFLLSMMHQADVVMSLRMLDTGTARDVTGVIRITIGDGYMDASEHGLEDKELLYFVGGDGSVKMFERGE